MDNSRANSDVSVLIDLCRTLLDILPCNVQRGKSWVMAWDELTDDDQNYIIETASIVQDKLSSVEKKYQAGGKDVRKE